MTVSRGRIVFALISLIGGVLLVGLGLGLTFFADEWAFIRIRSLADPGSLLAPHNEHWVTIPAIAYRFLVEVIGIGSYVPFQATLVSLHLVVAALAYRLLERETVPVVAIAAGTIIVFLGGGFENLLWAFQMTFVASTMFGLGAMAISDGAASPRRAVHVVLALVASLASSGLGVAMYAAVAAEWALDRRWRSHLPLLLLPGLITFGWYVAIGGAGIDTNRDPFTPEALGDTPRFVAGGIEVTLRTVSGLPSALAALVAFALMVYAIRFRDGRMPLPRLTGFLVGIVVLYVLAGLVRGGVLEDGAGYTRYSYLPAIFGIIAIGYAVGRPTSSSLAPRTRLAGLMALAAWTTVALVFNLRLLIAGRELFLERAERTRALVTVALEKLPPGVDPDRSLVLVPSPTDLRSIVAQHGDPRFDSVVDWAVEPIGDDMIAEARRRLVNGEASP